MKGLAENIGLPDSLGVTLKFLEQEVDHLLALLFVAHDGGHLGLNIGPDHVYGRSGPGMSYPRAAPAGR